jgi:hypothetical protein
MVAFPVCGDVVVAAACSSGCGGDGGRGGEGGG